MENKENKEKQGLVLTGFQVAFMFVGAIMGAGFASGRELWQFMGLFGLKGVFGTVFVALCFVVLGSMTAYIARIKNTNDFAVIITPVGHPRLQTAVSILMSVMLFSVLITMSAAGGALLYQNYGINRMVGGVIICFFVVVTVLGDFERVSQVFKYIMPILFAVAVITSFSIIGNDFGDLGYHNEVQPAAMAPHWTLAAALYISYNLLAMIPMISSSSIHAKDERHAIIGSAFGGFLVGILALIIILALQKDMSFSDANDMPMLAYAQLISKPIGVLYSLILFVAIYSAATSNFYGFTTKIKAGARKKYIVIISACAAFALGLFGFKNIVAYMFSAEGYLGFLIILLLIVNFFTVYKGEKRVKNLKEEMRIELDASFFKDFPGENRNAYPNCIVRVTGGGGGEAYIIKGESKTALYDTGMACFKDNLLHNIELVLKAENRTLDYVFVSHTHYDHIGALPYILERWQNAVVCGNAKAQKVFQSQNALNVMKELGINARKLFRKENVEIITDGMRIDKVLEDGETISLGGRTITAYETKGHTDCSMSYYILPDKILISSESTGLLRGPGVIHTAPLKSVDDCIASTKKLKALDYDCLIIPHYGACPPSYRYLFFDGYLKEQHTEKEIIEKGIADGLSAEELLEEHKKIYWTEARAKAQPYAAYKLNTEILIKRMMKEHDERQ